MEPPQPNDTILPEGVVPPPSLPPGWAERLVAPRTGPLRSLRHRNYRLFWTGNFLSNIGTWMHQVALGWLVLQMTNSPFLLGLVGFVQFTPALLFSLPGGVIAYREILVIAFLLGTASAVNAPAYQAMVRDLSSREDVLNAIAMNSIQFNLSRFIGPTIAGILVSTVGLAICFYANAASFLAPLVALSLLQWHGELHAASGSAAERMAEGIRYLRGHKQILLLVSIVAMVSLFGLPYLIFLPVFARDILEVGARGLGYMTSASGGGALVGAFVLATWPHERRRGPLELAHDGLLRVRAAGEPPGGLAGQHLGNTGGAGAGGGRAAGGDGGAVPGRALAAALAMRGEK